MAMKLKVENLSGGYGPLAVLREVSFDANPGEVLVILGRNGAGKTSLLSAVAGILPTISNGKISVGDKDITRLPAHKRVKAKIGLVQEGKRIFRSRTVAENLLLGTTSQPGLGLKTSQRKDALNAAFDRFPILAEKRHDPAGGLSGGQQQMLAISQVLAAQPEVIMLDEPSAGLAPAIRNEVFDVATSLRDEGMTVVVVEQLVDIALDLADKVIVLDGGRVASAGTPEAYKDGSTLKNIYLGSA